MEKTKKYRPNVAAVILSSSYPFNCEVFLGRRNDIKDAWQFPQGGIDKGETPRQALFRELKEEIGTNDIEVLCEYPSWLSYDFPSSAKIYKFDGQTQKYFLVRLKNKAKINLFSKDAEFDGYKFVDVKNVLQHTNHFKKGIYATVLKYFKEKGFI
ncbi:MAG: RNA pyrophosphohydrolase [Campylobacter sp.]|nr:RNA pyrophosphohydrolase [Campylobacter sp.]